MFRNLIFRGENVIFSPILDMNNNEVISYDLSLHPNLEQIKRMLAGALEKFPDVKGVILHSDQGWQYHHRDFSSNWPIEHIC